MRILLAEDERPLAKALVKIFERNNYSADAVYNGGDALSFIELGNYDVAILDVMMPVMDGIEVLKRLRAAKNPIPVLILSAKSEIEDKVRGLYSGSNYYLTKPFDTQELLATIRAITRSEAAASSQIIFGNVTLDRATYELSSAKNSFRLANKEFQLIELLMSNPNCVIPNDRIIEKIWGYDNDTEMNVLWILFEKEAYRT